MPENCYLRPKYQDTQPDHPNAVKSVGDLVAGCWYNRLVCTWERHTIPAVHNWITVYVEAISPDSAILTDSARSDYKVPFHQLGLQPSPSGRWHTCNHLVPLREQ